MKLTTSTAKTLLLLALLSVSVNAFQGRALPLSSLRPLSRENRLGALNLMDPSIVGDTLSSSASSVDTSFSVSVDAASFLTNSDVWVFVAGVFPFAWATIQFWTRIAAGEPFGTGSDSVIIGVDDNPDLSRGRRVLGKDALIVAYALFAISAAVLGLVLYTVVTNDAPPAEFVSSVAPVEVS